MKKYLRLKNILVVFIVLFCMNFISGCTGNKLLAGNAVNKDDSKEVRTLNYDEVKDSLIRFHVIANSDNDEDQNLKIKVKNAVIDYLYPYLSNSESLDESRQIIEDNMDKVKEIAESVISENNYNYGVKVQLSRENFPDKAYGNIVLPQGNYEAFRIIIGSGEGRNWWCVMFPPLCFVDESKAEVEYDKVEEKINSANTKEENDESKQEDNNQDCTDESSEDNQTVEVKLKFVEVLEDLFK